MLYSTSTIIVITKIHNVIKINDFCTTVTSHEPRGVTGGFLAQNASNTEIVPMAWRHHGTYFSDELTSPMTWNNMIHVNASINRLWSIPTQVTFDIQQYPSLAMWRPEVLYDPSMLICQKLVTIPIACLHTLRPSVGQIHQGPHTAQTSTTLETNQW